MNVEQTLAIEWQCEKICRQFANYSDQDAFAPLCELFTEDGSYFRPSVPDTEIKGRQALHAAFLLRPPLVIRHLVLNCVIDVISSTSARGFSYIIYMSAPLTNEPLPLLSGPFNIGEFRDEFVLTEDGWKFSKRRGRLALTT